VFPCVPNDHLNASGDIVGTAAVFIGLGFSFECTLFGRVPDAFVVERSTADIITKTIAFLSTGSDLALSGLFQDQTPPPPDGFITLSTFPSKDVAPRAQDDTSVQDAHEKYVRVQPRQGCQ
jgi:hypothetical protein